MKSQMYKQAVVAKRESIAHLMLNLFDAFKLISTTPIISTADYN